MTIRTSRSGWRADVQASGILMLSAGDSVSFDLGSNRRNGKSKGVNLRMIETMGGDR